MIDFQHLEKYQENNRIEAKEIAGRVAAQHLGNVFGLWQHAGRCALWNGEPDKSCKP